MERRKEVRRTQKVETKISRFKVSRVLFIEVRSTRECWSKEGPWRTSFQEMRGESTDENERRKEEGWEIKYL